MADPEIDTEKNLFPKTKQALNGFMANENHGAVAFLDILGYQSFLNADPHEVAAQEVLKFIDSLQTTVLIPNKIGVYGEPLNPDDFESMVFSDSILLTAKLGANKYQNWLNLFALLEKVSHLSRLMFDYGLPLRGGVDIGPYRIVRHSFTGKAIASAHLLAEDLELACTAVSSEFEKVYFPLVEECDFMGVSNPAVDYHPLIRYHAPVKSGSGRKMLSCVNFCGHLHTRKSTDIKTKLEELDLKEYVLRSFWSHGKTMNASVERKAENTELFIRYSKIKQRIIFG